MSTDEPIPEDVDISAVIRRVYHRMTNRLLQRSPTLTGGMGIMIRSFGFEALLADPMPMDYGTSENQPWSVEQPDNLYGFFSL